ncbi:hypothetical protein ASPVEDRAFT_57030 [Aspergillus versicolor CBS 583.65]|uniref:Xaa-Pro dipeptidyl-peptidase C-terminal domain-containing protein n=1 Tax=Aspergillus versicolor CBS 583.65 TaxID=1036611 RepID=A0A1L9Q1X5_ASPVE|nr:uncharacterized protein ASPVEDRAFT_57030 [Aspergillus versicolor CBS 583.65]OJJ07753.1 hypothetical protein ASPVEDRAFT_57030 [Aspergillus versicolor CBS 583.65]
MTSVLQRAPCSLDTHGAQYLGCKPETVTIRKGHRKDGGHAAFVADTILDRDVKIPQRDSAVLRADIFRPKDAPGKLPVLMAWSPYGKTGQGFLTLHLVPGRVGVPQSRLSGYESFEAPDPAEWTARGYAVANVDIRGFFDSTGDIRWFGTSDGKDGYDAVEYIAELAWCSGKVALVGNSWLAATQRPPHLACITPLEGFCDFYRETLCRGGVPYTPFLGLFGKSCSSRNRKEDVMGMLDRYPLMNEYWEDKRAQIEKIEVPAYVLSSYSSGLHTIGSFRGFEEIPHQHKWLRVHPTFEWHDLYKSEVNDELQQFFDRYTKGYQNCWEQTPRVRVSTLAFNKADSSYTGAANHFSLTLSRSQNHIMNSVTGQYLGHALRYFYLSGDRSLNERPSSDEMTFSYQSDSLAMQADADGEGLRFEYTFKQRSYLIGYSKAILYMSCLEHHDMDVFVQLRKLDSKGKMLQNTNIPLTDISLKLSEAKIAKPIVPGEIVRLEIGLWPTGIVFEAGERLVLKIAGHHMCLAEFAPCRGGGGFQDRK